MPPKKRPSFGRKTSSAKRNAAYRAAETPDQRKARLKDQRARVAASRAAETLEQRKARLEDMRMRAAASRAALRRLFQGQNSQKSLRSCDHNEEETEPVEYVSALILYPEDDESVSHVSDIVYVDDQSGENRLNEDISDTEEHYASECEANEVEDPLSKLDVKHKVEPKIGTVIKEEEDSSIRDEDCFVEVKEEIDEATENMDAPL